MGNKELNIHAFVFDNGKCYEHEELIGEIIDVTGNLLAVKKYSDGEILYFKLHDNQTPPTFK